MALLWTSFYVLASRQGYVHLQSILYAKRIWTLGSPIFINFQQLGSWSRAWKQQAYWFYWFFSYHMCKHKTCDPLAFSKYNSHWNKCWRPCGLSFTVLVVYSTVKIWVQKIADFAIKMPNSDCETSESESSESSATSSAVPILALKVIQIVLQKAQNQRLI